MQDQKESKLSVLNAWTLVPLTMLMFGACDRRTEEPSQKLLLPPAELEYVGSESCKDCHEEQFSAWQGSHHDVAMQEAGQQTVLGDFGDTRYASHGVTSTFFREGARFMVRTDGPDGELHDYKVAYVFGVEPLQQYLIEFPGGRYQSLPVAWDSRPAAEGGQGWFHLYPGEDIDYSDELHWTGRNQNWNYMCAECHSTNLKKNYDVVSDSYQTTFSEIDVACEACHGPGSAHVQWTQGRSQPYENAGFSFKLGGRSNWAFSDDRPIASATEQTTNTEIDTCGRCHSRRRSISPKYSHGQSLLQTHVPALLTDSLYFPDGQIRDEVYVYGSFLQSRMYHAGVTCSDCHEPHSLTLRAQGNEVCAQCHRSDVFDSQEHHFHVAGSGGDQCVDCHMPERTYMVVDPRRDHSIRIPRPDLSVKLSLPNACNECHLDKTPKWAADVLVDRFGTTRRERRHFAGVFYASREGSPQAGRALIELASDEAVPLIVLATALEQLQTVDSLAAYDVVRARLRHDDPLIRRAAVIALRAYDPKSRLDLGAPLLADPVLAVRIAAANTLAGIPADQFDTVSRTQMQHASEEYIDANMTNAERPESHLNIGLFLVRQRNFDEAMRAYETALRLHADFLPALVNIADLLRATDRDAQGEAYLTRALEIEPDNADVHQAMGMWLVRQSRSEEALSYLQQAAELAPEQPYFGYLYAIALNSKGAPKSALEVLEETYRRHTQDRQILVALVTIHRDQGDLDQAIFYAEKLLALQPVDPNAQRLLASLRASKNNAQ